MSLWEQKEIMKYKLKLEVLHGKFENDFVEMEFNAPNDDKAREFAKEAANLKTFNKQYIEFGGYEIKKRTGPFWLRISNANQKKAIE